MESLIFFKDTDLPISVDLQDPYSYNLRLFIIISALTVVSIIALIAVFLIRKKMKPTVKKVEKIPVFKPKAPAEAQKEYLAKIDAIEQKYKDGTFDVRTTHLELSAVVRMFVHDVTGIEAQNFSLNELKEKNVYQISGLIEEFYAPEFAQRTDKETMDSISDARKVILTWK